MRFKYKIEKKNAKPSFVFNQDEEQTPNLDKLGQSKLYYMDLVWLQRMESRNGCQLIRNGLQFILICFSVVMSNGFIVFNNK